MRSLARTQQTASVSAISLATALVLFSYTKEASAQLQVDPPGAPGATIRPRVYISRVAGTPISRELTKSIVAIEENEAARLELVPASSPNQADVVFGALIVEDANGCTVKGQVRIVATKEVMSDSEDCNAGAEDEPAASARQLADQRILRAARVMIPRLLARASKPIELPPLPPLPPPPEAEPPPPPEKTDGWVFEVGLDLHTRKFIGLGQMVANRNETDRFGGVFALTFVRNDMKRFAGVLQFAFGRSDAEEIRAPFGVGLVRNKYGDFAGAFAISVVINQAGSFAGVSQVALYNSASHFAGAMQLGGVNHSERSFAGIGQLGAVNLAQGDFVGVAQLGLGNASYDGKVNVVAQVGGFANLVEQEVRAGMQVAPANIFGRFKGGVQLGAANFLGSKSLGDFFAHWVNRGRSRSSFQGAMQLGALNATYGGVNTGLQLGAANLNGRFAGAIQAGVFNLGGEYEGALQVGVMNVTMNHFRGFLALGPGNVTDHLEGAQLGVANIAASTVRGVQIGVFNYTETLSGVQIGVLNCIMNRETLPCLPIANVGF